MAIEYKYIVYYEPYFETYEDIDISESSKLMQAFTSGLIEILRFSSETPVEQMVLSTAHQYIWKALPIKKGF
ncbi:MAG TPA: hypothetical protein VLM20_00425 [Methylophilaceae bacterium]|nr:hypothetical protein [Methylophilaceae bacterium]